MTHHRTARLALGAALLPLALAGCGSSEAGASPGSAAAEWATQLLVKSDQKAAADLQCHQEAISGLRLTPAMTEKMTSVEATRSQRTSDKAGWNVTLQPKPSSAAASFEVLVVKRDGKYLVCDGAGVR